MDVEVGDFLLSQNSLLLFLLHLGTKSLLLGQRSIVLLSHLLEQLLQLLAFLVLLNLVLFLLFGQKLALGQLLFETNVFVFQLVHFESDLSVFGEQESQPFLEVGP